MDFGWWPAILTFASALALLRRNKIQHGRRPEADKRHSDLSWRKCFIKACRSLGINPQDKAAGQAVFLDRDYTGHSQKEDTSGESTDIDPEPFGMQNGIAPLHDVRQQR